MTQDRHSVKMPMIGVSYALISALLFGLSTPLSKIMLGQIHPIMLAGLFYLGSGLGLACILSCRSLLHKQARKTAAISGSDWRWLSPAILCEGVLAPLLLMFGLQVTHASTVSLFLNLESVFTALIAWFAFKEHFDQRIVAGMIAIVLGAVLLSLDSSAGHSVSGGIFLIAGACLCWALDNNFTNMVSGKDAAQIACIKGLVAGLVNLALAMLTSVPLPSLPSIIEALLIGFLAYGVSLALFVLALKHIGAARTGAYFAFAPFFGAALSILLLHEAMTVQFLSCTALMGLGLWLHLSEKHTHEHTHEGLEHSHWHLHDDHHQHEHQEENGQYALDAEGGHVHSHKHERLVHEHPHFPDQHHRHLH